MKCLTRPLKGKAMIFSALYFCCLLVGTTLSQGYDGAFEQRKIVAAEFALEELRKTSDTGVYDSLKLLEVLNAKEEDGIFHHNMIMDLKLGSPYFVGDQTIGYFSVVVMRHKETGGRSLAIDEFPVMDEAAVEKYWIAKVNRKRAEREEAFRRMEVEALLLEDEDFQAPLGESGDEGAGGGERVSQESLQDVSVEELFRVLEATTSKTKRKEASQRLLGHLSRYREQEGHTAQEEAMALSRQFADMEEEEELLQSFTLPELFALSVGSQDGLFSDYLVYRSRQILDAVLSKHA